MMRTAEPKDGRLFGVATVGGGICFRGSAYICDLLMHSIVVSSWDLDFPAMKGDDSAAKKRRHDGVGRVVSGERPARAKKAQAALDVSLINKLLLNGMRKAITERNLPEAETARALKIKRQSVNHLMHKAKVVPVALVVRFGEWMGIDGDKLLGAAISRSRERSLKNDSKKRAK